MRFKTAIIGAGVIGLATARSILHQQRSSSSFPSKDLSEAGPLVVFEREADIGSHSSSRNSEVIHAGFYYPPGSQKAKFCVQGRRLLYQYLAQRSIPHRRCGKLVVAGDHDQREKLYRLIERGEANDVEDLKIISAKEVSKLEPWVKADGGALSSSSTGIVDSHCLMRELRKEIRELGGEVVTKHEVLAIELLNLGGFRLSISSGEDSQTFVVDCDQLVNTAGLWSPHWWGHLGENTSHHLSTRYARGRYWSLSGSSPTSRLIYPLPVSGGLGVHLTVDLNGRARFGPDVDWLEARSAEELGRSPSYHVSEESKTLFIEAIKQYWPSIPCEKLSPDYAGMRIKVSSANQVSNDFQLLGPHQHQVDGLIHLLGIESPGLTSCLAIGEWVAQQLSH